MDTRELPADEVKRRMTELDDNASVEEEEVVHKVQADQNTEVAKQLAVMAFENVLGEKGREVMNGESAVLVIRLSDNLLNKLEILREIGSKTPDGKTSVAIFLADTKGQWVGRVMCYFNNDNLSGWRFCE